jgi:hypothetical protein
MCCSWHSVPAFIELEIHPFPRGCKVQRCWRNYMLLRDFAQVNMFHVEHKTENFAGACPPLRLLRCMPSSSFTQAHTLLFVCSGTYPPLRLLRRMPSSSFAQAHALLFVCSGACPPLRLLRRMPPSARKPDISLVVEFHDLSAPAKKRAGCAFGF